MSDRSPPKPPLFYRFVRDADGQSETIGIILLLGITVIGSVGIVAFGSTALNDIEDASSGQRSEHTMTLLDSRAAMVALGDADSQSVQFSTPPDGSMEVREDAGWIRIEHQNYTGNGDDEIIYNRSLGALVYESGDRVTAYQGGGVWRKTDNGSVMVSPPEFHYRSSTLTFPVIRVTGSGSASGDVEVNVRSAEEFSRVYPNLSQTDPAGDEVGNPYNVTSDPYTNPVVNGTVNVTVHSEYYQGWAQYFETRTTGNVTVYHNNNTVEVELISVGTVGDFEMPANGNSIDIRGGSGGHPYDNFTVILRPDDDDSASFSNLKWSLTVEEGSREFEIHLRDSGGGGCGDPIQATVYYSEDGGNSYQGWKDSDAYTYECLDYNGDGDDEVQLRANLTSLSTELEYDDLKSSDTGDEFDNPNDDTLISTATWDEHEDSVSWEPEDMGSCGSCVDKTTMFNLTNHYLTQFGTSYEIEVNDFSNSDTVEEDDSRGTIKLATGGGQFITFLHVTENKIVIELE